MFGAAMIAVGLVLASSGGGSTVDRARRVYRPARQCRHQRAALHLCVALVRPAPRDGAGAARQRIVDRRGDLGAGFRCVIGRVGWRETMLIFAAVEVALIVPVAAIMLRPPPEGSSIDGIAGGPRRGMRGAWPAPHVVLGADRASPVFCAASRWRCRKATSSRSAAISASRRRRARRCCRCCSAAPSSAVSSGAGSPTGSAGCARCWPARSARSPR